VAGGQKKGSLGYHVSKKQCVNTKIRKKKYKGEKNQSSGKKKESIFMQKERQAETEGPSDLDTKTGPNLIERKKKKNGEKKETLGGREGCKKVSAVTCSNEKKKLMNPGEKGKGERKGGRFGRWAAVQAITKVGGKVGEPKYNLSVGYVLRSRRD